MKITTYIDFIKKEFSEIQKRFKMVWVDEGEYGIILENQHIKVTFFTERGESNDSIGIPITNKEKDEFYDLPLIIERLEIQGEYNDDAFLSKIQSMNDSIEITVYAARVILENYASKIFTGDFSQVGEGYPN